MTYKELLVSDKYYLHHTSWKNGYMSRKGDVVIYPYNGRFGKGYAVEMPSWRSTKYHLITYYIEK